ncbi:MAG: hypothetical protein JWQ37_1110 [Blastococcus sp.]|nr:hypothetical protein [Blastococcus sp.]
MSRSLAMSASLAGLACAAAPDGRSTKDSSVVSTFSPAADSATPSPTSSPTSSAAAAPSGSVADHRGGQADDPATARRERRPRSGTRRG